MIFCEDALEPVRILERLLAQMPLWMSGLSCYTLNAGCDGATVNNPPCRTRVCSAATERSANTVNDVRLMKPA
jgi:hypothetical protein